MIPELSHVRIAVVGATGAVGRQMLTLLGKPEHKGQIVPIASAHSAGKRVSLPFGRSATVQDIAAVDFSAFDLCLMSAGATVSQAWAERISAAGCIVVDNSSAWRTDPSVPLVVPEVNPNDLTRILDNSERRIIANPNCVAIPATVALNPLHAFGGLTHVKVTSYQSVSGAGQKGIDALYAEERRTPFTHSPFPEPIHRNVIPQIGVFGLSNETGEEEKVMFEIQKILGLKLKIQATCVRVPTLMGHALDLVAGFENPIPWSQVLIAYGEKAPGILHQRQLGSYMTPRRLVEGDEDRVCIGRVRPTNILPNGLAMWVAANNLRKGAALNAIQIAQELATRHLL